MILKKLAVTAIAAVMATTCFGSDAWLYSGRIGGTFIYNSMGDADLTALLDKRAAENVSILEFDSRLSYYLTDQEFATEVGFLDRAAELANARGMKAVIYYPTFEVLTANAIDDNGTVSPDSFASVHPDWVQQGIDGTPNVFYGGQEVWVSPGEESAWLSPNSGYRDYFINRVEQLAATDLDGVWLDVPIYLDTGTLWTGTEPDAAADFRAWTIAQGLNGGAGYTVPTIYEMEDPGFRAWIKWRHINVASFLDDVRAAAQAINPDFAVIVENFPLDYFDSTAYGLDGSYLPVEDNFIRVWETDNVSNTQAMKWSTPDDFENKIAMLKWGKSVHADQPSWSFSYGYEPLDAALTMSATVATQNVPFESKTPTMLNTVDENFRRNWFGYVADHEPELLEAQRTPQLGIWYSSATRDFQDYDVSGKFGLFSVTTPPVADDTWWASRPTDSVVTAPHLGGYRGMSAAMIRMNIPYTVVHGRDNGPLADSSELDMLLLPSVGAMSDADAQYLRQYVQGGGTLLATGILPGTLDETGAERSQSIVADLFDFPGAPAARVNKFGLGLVIYRPDITGASLFGEQLDENNAADTLTELEKLVRIHTDEPFTVEDGEDIYIDRAIVDDSEHLLYVVNYSGLQLPLVQSIRQLAIHYQAPAGRMVTSVVASTPDIDGLNGFATVSHRGNGIYKIEVPVDQFALLEIQLSAAPAADPLVFEGPQFEDPAHAEAAQSGLDFVLNRLRNASLPEPNRFGVHTNLIDNNDSTEIYTNGHNVTGEHMGLLLRTSACMGDQSAYNEAYRYVSELMQSPLYHVPNWSIDKNAQRPFLFYDDFRTNWFNANAPLDDLRLIHGLIDGYENFGLTDSSELASEMFEGLYWTTVTDRGRNNNNRLFPQYPGGLLGFAWDWSEVDDASLTPAATATGTGYLGTDLLPVDYQDLGAIAHAAERDHRWEGVLQATTQLLLDSEINLSGLYYNGYRPNGDWTGDFEYQGTRRGEHLKTIQVLWTAIHLARVAESPTTALSAAQKALATGSATRSLNFFKSFYQSNQRVPEYLKYNGADVDDCVNNQPANCLARGTESLFDGEARIYAQIARLALLLGDADFSNRIINEKIITDRVANVADPRYGVIGVSTTGQNDAEAWNILESVFSICLNATTTDDNGPPVVNNNSPVAATDRFTTNEESALTLTAAQLLSNDTDTDNDTLSVSGLPSRSANGGRIELLPSGDWVYTPAINFNGSDTISYAISDGRGGSAIGEINIEVILVPKTDHVAESVTILSGALNYGSVDFLNSDDADTYDIDSAPTATGNIVDWFSSGRIVDRTEVSRLQATYSGHYSIAGVTQETFLYNFVLNEWVSFDTRVVGDQTDSVVRIDITENPRDFIATDGETRIRVRGVQASQAPTVWANSLSWKAYRGAELQTNTVPVASNVSVTTTTNTQVAIELSGSDADNDPLTYALDVGALSGQLSGTAPLLTYNPPQGFAGTESFNYTVNDGLATSAQGSVSITVVAQGTISNLATAITLDGNLTDWSGYIPFADDPADTANPLDWRKAWMAHDASAYYLAYQNNGPLDVSWGQTIYLDIDNNAATGYQAGLSIGADRVIQGRFLYRYTGTGANWSWEFITELQGESANGNFEYSFERSALNNTDTIRLAFVGSNEPYGGTVEDLYPDGVYNTSALSRHLEYSAVVSNNSAPVVSDMGVVATERNLLEFVLNAADADDDALFYTIISQPQNGVLGGTAPQMSYMADDGFTGTDSFTYRVSDGALNSAIATVSITVQSVAQANIPSNPVTGITVNGDLSEWTQLTSFAIDPDDVTGAENPVDYLSAAMAHDGSRFYLSFSNDGQDVSALPEWLYTIYIDTDLNTNTGYQSGLAIGADYMQQGSGVFKYNGTGSDWTWLAVAGSERQVLGASVELAIARQSIGDPANLRFVMIGDNLSINGSVEDVYPDGTYDSTAAIRYLEYRTGGSQLEPLLLPAIDSTQLPVFGRQEASRNPRLSEQTGAVVAGGSGAIGLGIISLLLAGGLSVRYWRRRSAQGRTVH